MHALKKYSPDCIKSINQWCGDIPEAEHVRISPIICKGCNFDTKLNH